MGRQVTLEGSPKNRRWAAATRKIYGKIVVPSGYLTVRHGIDGPFIVDFPIKNGGSFHGYVSLQEGKFHRKHNRYMVETTR